MVTEAQSKVNEAVKQTMKCIGHLAVFTRTDISFFEENTISTVSLQVKKFNSNNDFLGKYEKYLSTKACPKQYLLRSSCFLYSYVS